MINNYGYRKNATANRSGLSPPPPADGLLQIVLKSLSQRTAANRSQPSTMNHRAHHSNLETCSEHSVRIHSTKHAHPTCPEHQLWNHMS